MSIRKLLLPLFALCLLQGACKENTAPPQEIGVVDLSRVVQISEPGKAFQNFLSELQKAYAEQLASAQNKLVDDPENEEVLSGLQLLYSSLQGRMQQEEQNASRIMQDSVMKTVAEVRSQNKLKIVFFAEQVVDMDASVDITDKVIEAINKVNVEFKPITGDPNTDTTATPEAAPATPETAASEAAPAAPETAAPEATPATPETAASEAAPVAPETATPEAAPAAPEMAAPETAPEAASPEAKS